MSPEGQCHPSCRAERGEAAWALPRGRGLGGTVAPSRAGPQLQLGGSAEPQDLTRHRPFRVRDVPLGHGSARTRTYARTPCVPPPLLGGRGAAVHVTGPAPGEGARRCLRTWALRLGSGRAALKVPPWAVVREAATAL